jgi:UDP-glucose 4-epimerase
MKVFITGVAGFLGSYLADRMLELGWEVSGNDNLIGGYLDNVPDRVDFHQVDCKYLNTMTRLLKGVDVVVHTACTAYEGLSVFSPHLVVQNTTQITATLLSASVQCGVKRFVYCSSMARYGESHDMPYRETSVPRPQDPYGIAKYASELLVANICTTHGLEYVIAVPHNIIGPRQKYDDPYRNVASIMINLMLQGRQPIIYGDGQQLRSFSFIQDCVYCLERMIMEKNVVGQVVNIGPDNNFITINELAGTIGRLLKFQVEPIYVKGRPQEVKNAYCSSDKARSLLGYKDQTSLESGLQSIIDYIRRRGVKKFRYHLDLEIVSDLTPETWKNRLF